MFPGQPVATILSCPPWSQSSKLSSLGARTGDLPSSECVAEAFQELQCFYPASIKTSIQLTCPTQRHFALLLANTKVLQPPSSTGEAQITAVSLNQTQEAAMTVVRESYRPRQLASSGPLGLFFSVSEL